MAEKSFIVKKGWIIAKDEFGNMLPFFLHVRDKDIVWQSRPDKDIDRLIKNGMIADIKEISPSQQIEFNSGIWRVILDCNRRLCTIRTALSLDSELVKLASNKHSFYADLSLPVVLLNNDRFFIKNTLSSNNMNIISSNISLGRVIDTENNIKNLSLYVVNSGFTFPDNYRNNDDYKSSNIYIEISGEIFKENADVYDLSDFAQMTTEGDPMASFDPDRIILSDDVPDVHRDTLWADTTPDD